MNNPLLESRPLPAFDRIAPAHVLPALETVLKENKQAIASLCTGAAHIDILYKLETLQDRLDTAWSPVSHLNAVMNNDEWRAVYNQALPLLTSYYTEIAQNKDLFAIYEKLKNSAEFSSYNKAQQQTILNAIRDFTLSGVNLPDDKKKTFAELSEKISAQQSKFSDNVLDATQAWDKLCTDAKELKGLPETALGLLASLAQQKNQEGYRITLDFPSYNAVMTYADNRDLRAQAYIAYVTRASELGQQADKLNNTPILVDVLRLREQQTHLLGYKHYADVSVIPKMAESANQVFDFLNELIVKARPAAEKELQELKQFAAEHCDIQDLKPWDLSYVSEKLKQKAYSISQEKIREYFPIDHVLSGLFSIVEKVFAIQVKESKRTPVWHNDVRFFDLYDGDNYLASFYLDLYARNGKRGGAWMGDCRSRRQLENGDWQRPIAYLTCNFNPPINGDTALLTHSEMVTLFHEFGHGLQHMLTTINVSAVAGINGVAWDAVELPSQFMENFCWTAEGLNILSQHYQSKETLPDALREKLLAARNFQAASGMMRQLEFSLFDFSVHATSVQNGIDVQHIMDTVREKTSIIEAPKFNRFQNCFGHIFAGGYAAGYYSYKWAEVLSADAFSRFKEEGVFNPSTGKLFRDTVLALGGSEPAEKVFTLFRGRKPSPDALLKHYGLLAS